MERLVTRLTASFAYDAEPSHSILSPHQAARKLSADSLSNHEPRLSLIEIASHENLAIGLAKELMELVEMLSPDDWVHGMGVVRDDQADQASGGTRWYRDIISQWHLS